MSDQYPPYRGPRKLVRSRNNRVLGGVCGGLAEYANMDPTLVRVLTVVIAFFTGVPIILYLIALFVIPEEDTTNSRQQNYPPVNGPQWSYGPYGQDSSEGLVPPSYAPRADQGPSGRGGYGGPPTPSEDQRLWGPQGAPWEQGSQIPPPSGRTPSPGQTPPPPATPGPGQPATPSPSDEDLR